MSEAETGGGAAEPAPAGEGQRSALGAFGRIALRIQLLASVGVLLALPFVLRAPTEKMLRARCAHQLNGLALAARQYAADKGQLPQVGPLDPFRGRPRPLGSAKVVRTLLWYGYHDAPERWICPASDDQALPWTGAEPKRWFWGGEHERGDPAQDPAGDGLPDPDLKETTELSYGWTRLPIGLNAPAETPLAADRAIRFRSRDPENLRPGEVGNHWAGMTVVGLDGATRWEAKEQGRELPERVDALEGLWRDLSRAPHTPPPPPKGRVYAQLAAVAGWLALLAVFYWLSRRDTPSPPT